MRAHAPQTQPLTPERIAGAGLRTFFRIAERWHLSAEEQMTLLGVTSPSTYYKWKSRGTTRLAKDTLERLSYLFGIYKDLQVLLPNEQLADSWLRRPNSHPLYGGRTPLERMLSGHVADLYVVRQHLDAERGGWS
jgi:hypothetical protein